MRGQFGRAECGQFRRALTCRKPDIPDIRPAGTRTVRAVSGSPLCRCRLKSSEDSMLWTTPDEEPGNAQRLLDGAVPRLLRGALLHDGVDCAEPATPRSHGSSADRNRAPWTPTVSRMVAASSTPSHRTRPEHHVQRRMRSRSVAAKRAVGGTGMAALATHPLLASTRPPNREAPVMSPGTAMVAITGEARRRFSLTIVS